MKVELCLTLFVHGQNSTRYVKYWEILRMSLTVRCPPSIRARSAPIFSRSAVSPRASLRRTRPPLCRGDRIDVHARIPAVISSQKIRRPSKLTIQRELLFFATKTRFGS